MSVAELLALRKALGLTQTEMGRAIGLSIRTYNAIETGATKIRTLHVLAAERVALTYAAERRQADFLPAEVLQDALELSGQITGRM